MAEQHRYTFPGEHMYDGITLGAVYKPSGLDKVKNFTFRNDDVLLVGYPKSGRLWLEELVWLLQNDLDLHKAREQSLRAHRVLPIEISAGPVSNVERLQHVSSPRIMSTFMYSHFFKDQLRGQGHPKVIVMIRNPKDVLVSYYHFYRMAMMTGNFPGTWDEFFRLAQDKSLNLGDWFDHVAGWWDLGKDKPHFLFLHYEDIIANPQQGILKVANFLGKDLTQESLQLLQDHVNFESMRQNPTTNMKDIPFYKQEISEFLRKGVVGDWMNHMTDDQSRLIDRKYNEIIKSKGLNVKFEISHTNLYYYFQGKPYH